MHSSSVRLDGSSASSLGTRGGFGLSSISLVGFCPDSPPVIDQPEDEMIRIVVQEKMSANR